MKNTWKVTMMYLRTFLMCCYLGKKWIQKERLRTLDTESIYKAEDGSLGCQRRDILKEYANGRYMIAAMGIENQTVIDRDMPIRVMGYDYAGYREQIKRSGKRVPVITIVLNFSKKEWKTPLALKEILQIPEELEPFVQDYKIHVFNIAYLSKEIRNCFTSDFKVVADYFAEKDTKDYKPDRQEIVHVEGVLEMLRVFTDDMRYDTIKKSILEEREKGGKITMCTFVDKMVNIGIERGREEGIRVLVRTCQSLSVSREETKERIKEGFLVSDSEADKELEQYW